MIGVVTDSSADIPPDIRNTYDIACVPLSIIFDKEKYIDGIDLTVEDFYRKMRSAQKLPTTAFPSVGQFEATYKRMAEKYDEILSIHISEKMSGTAGSARKASEMVPNVKITVVDSEVVHSPLGIMAVEAAKLARKGANMQELLELIEKLKKNIKTLFIVETLKYLEMGGRIGKARGLLGSALKIHPVLTLREGEVAPFKTVRGWENAKRTMIETMSRDIKDGSRYKIIIGHADNLAEAQELVAKCREMFSPKEVDIWWVGPVVGTHAGPGLLAAVYYEALD